MKAEIGQPYCRDCGALMESSPEKGRLSYTCTECVKHAINPYLKQNHTCPSCQNEVDRLTTVTVNIKHLKRGGAEREIMSMCTDCAATNETYNYDERAK